MNLYALLFLVCFDGQPCQVLANVQPQTSLSECHLLAEDTLRVTQERVTQGQLAPHRASYICVPLGDKT